MIDFTNDLAHKKFLCEEANEDIADSNQSLLETSYSTEHSKDVIHLSWVWVEHAIASNVNSHYVAFFAWIRIVIAGYVLHRVVKNIIRRAKLEDFVLQRRSVIHHEQVRHFRSLRI